MSDKVVEIKSHVVLFQALASPMRVRILHALREPAMSLTQTSDEAGVKQTNASHNLRRRVVCGLITVARLGKSRIYSLSKETVLPILEIMANHLRKSAGSLPNSDLLER
ncbi:MAG: winged helix-turn-helix transcriptional regulator [Nitrososphaerota archaeon]|nr:winged helix-turn-helix transcriptional regulator [Nitrososphaerota archaeon]MDG7025915.1 winged helix-turn-helix transcriptional regulator [Nitrososphaerota archaeon]